MVTPTRLHHVIPFLPSILQGDSLIAGICTLQRGHIQTESHEFIPSRWKSPFAPQHSSMTNILPNGHHWLHPVEGFAPQCRTGRQPPWMSQQLTNLMLANLGVHASICPSMVVDEASGTIESIHWTICGRCKCAQGRVVVWTYKEACANN